jgi:hypothetical protein
MGGARAGPARMGRRRATVLRHTQGADAQGRAADGAHRGAALRRTFPKKGVQGEAAMERHGAACPVQMSYQTY